MTTDDDAPTDRPIVLGGTPVDEVEGKVKAKGTRRELEASGETKSRGGLRSKQNIHIHPVRGATAP